MQKKKYAALKLNNLDAIRYDTKNQVEPEWIKEMKGIDIVRRDWCDLTRIIGHQILDFVLDN